LPKVFWLKWVRMKGVSSKYGEKIRIKWSLLTYGKTLGVILVRSIS
jgi:hypothetical protein